MENFKLFLDSSEASLTTLSGNDSFKRVYK